MIGRQTYVSVRRLSNLMVRILLNREQAVCQKVPAQLDALKFSALE